jgi:hypothetical protein
MTTHSEWDLNTIDRGVEALCRFVFPGVVVPRHEMVVAVLEATCGEDGWRERLPAKRVYEAGPEESNGA